MIHEVKLLQELRKKGWRFGVERNRRTLGRMNHDKKYIIVNPVTHIVSTIIHELIHVENHKFHEELVVALEMMRRREVTCKMEDEILHAFSPDLARVMQQIHRIRGGL